MLDSHKPSKRYQILVKSGDNKIVHQVDCDAMQISENGDLFAISYHRGEVVPVHGYSKGMWIEFGVQQDLRKEEPAPVQQPIQEEQPQAEAPQPMPPLEPKEGELVLDAVKEEAVV